MALPFEVVEISIEANPAKRDHDPHILEALYFAIQIRSALRQLLRKRLVIGRSAAYRRRDVEAFQLKAILAIGRGGLVGKAGFIQNREHELARRISGERPAGAVRAVRSGSQAEDKNARIGIAKAGHGLAPVIAIAIGATPLTSN